MLKIKMIALIRAAFGFLTLAAIMAQIFRSSELGVYYPVNFFSYFTNLSNIFAALVLLCTAYLFAIGSKTNTLFDIVRGASVMCMVVVGIVFSLLLRNEDVGVLMQW